MIGNSLRNNRLLSRLIGTKTIESNVCKHLHKTQISTTNESPIDDNCGNHYDIVINGGGIVGFATLLALKNSPFLKDSNICLIERQLEPNIDSLDLNKNEFSNRVSSITTSSKKLFERIGVWNDFKEYAKPIQELYVWSHKYKNAINFRSNSNHLDEDFTQNSGDNEDVVCYVIENNRILSSLQNRISRLEHNVCYGTVVTDVRSDGNSVKIDTKCLKNELTNSLSTHLLVGSDGFNSIVRQKSDLELFEHDLEQLAIVGTIAVETDSAVPDNNIAFQRFVPFDNSVIALLPLNREICSFVWSVSKQSAQELMQMSEQQFVDHMNDQLFAEAIPSSPSIIDRMDDMITNLVPKPLINSQTPRFSASLVLSLTPGSRASFPLKFSTTLPYLVGSPNNSKHNNNNQIVLIGDAAHRVHPLAGQGLNLGIGDGIVLSECIHNCLSRGENLFVGNPFDSKPLENCLFEFERKRQLKSIAMVSAIHSMQSIFGCIPSNLLNVFNSSNFLKQKVINFANSY